MARPSVKSGAACFLLLLATVRAESQLIVTPFDSQGRNVITGNSGLMAAADGKVLMRLSGISDEEPARIWSSLYVLDSRGMVLQRIDFPQTESTAVTPYRNGFVARHYYTSPQCNPPCGRYIPGRSELVYHDLSHATAEPVVLDRREGAIEIVGGLDRDELYVIDVESEADQRSRITRFDAEFQPVWSRSFRLLDWGSVTATDDGVVLEQQYYQPVTRFVLRAIGRDGAERWNTVVPERITGDVKYVPPGFIVAAATARLSPYRFDATTGQMLPGVEFPPANFAAPTEDGLLLVGPMLGQSYAAMMNADGSFAWRRRFTQDPVLRTFESGIMTNDGRLLLVAKGEFPSQYSLVSVERDAASLELGRSACLSDASPHATEYDQRLQRHGIYVVSPNAPADDSPRRQTERGPDGCPLVTESQYVEFMKELSLALPSPSSRMRAPAIAIRLLKSGELPRLVSYGLGIGGWSGHGMHAEFAVPHDQGQEFSRLLLNVLRPHEARIIALREQFVRRTNVYYGARIDETLHIQQALADLEAAAATLNERFDTMTPEQIGYVRGTQPTECVGAVLTPSAFGTGHDDDPYGARPLSDAVDTLLHIAAMRRKSFAAGDRCTIG